MQDVALRKHKDALLTRLAVDLLAQVHPNLISLAALIVGLLSVASILGRHFWLGLILWILNRGLDGLDGVVARVHHKQSDFGAYLDLLLDYVIYLAIPLAFVWIAPVPFTVWAAMALLAAYIINLLSWTVLSALLEKRRHTSDGRLTGLEMPVGLIEGAETILFYSLLFLLPGQVGPLLFIFAALVLVTAGQRICWSYRHLDR